MPCRRGEGGPGPVGCALQPAFIRPVLARLQRAGPRQPAEGGFRPMGCEHASNGDPPQKQSKRLFLIVYEPLGRGHSLRET